jgi:hypothetical protein
MRGAGVCGTAVAGVVAGRGAIGVVGELEAAIVGDAGATGATTAGGGAAGRGGTVAGTVGAAGVGAAGFSACGGATTVGLAGGTTGETIVGATGNGGGGAGFATGGTTTGFATNGAGATGFGAGTTASFCCVMALSTSPGREICDRSILVLISSSPRSGRAGFAAPDACDSDAPRMCARTFSASWSSSELECVFFSVTPTIVSTSRMALLLTSSSLARSLIRTLLIRPFFPALGLCLHSALTGSAFCTRTSFRSCLRVP